MDLTIANSRRNAAAASIVWHTGLRPGVENVIVGTLMLYNDVIEYRP